MATFKKVVTETDADTIAQSTTGSAATLTTARAIALSGNVTGTADFNGSAGISISTTIANDSVDTAQIADEAIDDNKLADDAVTSSAIATNAVGADALNVSGDGTSGYLLSSDADGSFSWIAPSTGDITGIDAGNGITISDGSTATPEVAVNAALTTVTSMYNNALSIGAGSGKARMEFGTSVINFAADADAITLVLENQDASTDEDNLRPKTHRGVNLGTSNHHFNNFFTRQAVATDAIIGTLSIGTPGVGNNTEVTATGAELNILSGVTADSDEINILDGLTATTTQLNYVDATSSIQTQLNAKAPVAAPSFTGNVSVGNNLTVGGDLTITGKTITTATETLEIADNTLILNSDLGSGTAGVDAGFVVERGSSGDNAAFFYDNDDASWKVGTSSTQALPTSGARIALQSVKQTLDTSDESVPVGGFQVAGGVAYVRTA